MCTCDWSGMSLSLCDLEATLLMYEAGKESPAADNIRERILGFMMTVVERCGYMFRF